MWSAYERFFSCLYELQRRKHYLITVYMSLIIEDISVLEKCIDRMAPLLQFQTSQKYMTRFSRLGESFLHFLKIREAFFTFLFTDGLWQSPYAFLESTGHMVILHCNMKGKWGHCDWLGKKHAAPKIGFLQ